MFIGDYMLDPPEDPPLTTCPDCDGIGVCAGEDDEACLRCDGDGEAYLTDEEVRDAVCEAMIDRAEARRDYDTDDVPC